MTSLSKLVDRGKKTPDGYNILLSIRNGLLYMNMRPFTSQEWDTLPQVILIADVDWNLSILNN